ncbi:DUF4352 domain-containing protein [Candidatus Desulfosporosinus nitrosoreducens]|uniref:DUF4352 domain-containing protein n=1 Tax=Candidatus Desulfosporosinus nitrosoreducens TaxID=3401928 RepID=UPI00280B4D54|nr:DUF4352 domain-containing protein [Desulfosporosinus sp. PR]
MKKFISILAIIGLLFVSGCSSAAKPDKTVSDFIDAGKKFDLAQMATLVNPANANSKAKITDITKGGDKEADQYEKYFLDYFKENAAKITYTIKEPKIDGDKATVPVDFKYVNGSPLLKATIGDAFSQVMSLAFTGVQMKDDDMNQLFMNSMNKQKTNVQESFTEKTVDFNLVKADNKWYIDNPSDELLDVFTSNFISVGKEISNSFKSASDNSSQDPTFMEQAKKDNATIVNKTIGDEIVLATIKLKINSAEEKQTLTPQSGSPVNAKDGTKFVVVNADLTNITNKAITMEPDLLMIDNKEREFKTYDKTVGAIDNYLDYRKLAPSIKENGNWVYELPNDATGYSLAVMKSGTNELYLIKLK